MNGPKVKSVPADETIAAVPDDDEREPTKEEIMKDLRTALRDAMAGKKGMPAREFLEELIRERDMKSLQAEADD